MKKPIVIIAAALALSFSVHAQTSVEDGVKMVRYERYQKAKEILTPLATTDARANYYLGLAELGQGNVDAAEAAFKKYPEDGANIAGAARVAFEKNNATEGMRLAEEAADKAKKKDMDPMKFAADAITYTKGGDINKAIAWYTEVLEKSKEPEYAAQIALGDAQRKTTTDAGKAMTNWETVTTADPKNSLAYSRIGSLWYGAKRYDLALEAYQKAMDADPTNPLPYRDLANAYFYSGKYELAKQNIEKYLELSDKTCEDKVQHANLIFLTKEYNEAISEINSVKAECGEKPYMYRMIGYSQVEIGDSLDAKQSMQTFFAKQDPAKILPSDYFYMGKIYLKLNELDSADYYYNMAVAKDTSSDYRELYEKIVDDYKTIKSDTGYGKVGDWYGKLNAKDTGTVVDLYNWGLYSYYGKNYDSAAKAFQIMEEKFPDQPTGVYWRARVAAAKDPQAKSGEAAPFFERWLAIPPTEQYTQKDNDKKIAYRYLAIYAYNEDNKENLNKYMKELEALDPDDAVLKQLKSAVQSQAAAK